MRGVGEVRGVGGAVVGGDCVHVFFQLVFHMFVQHLDSASNYCTFRPTKQTINKRSRSVQNRF